MAIKIYGDEQTVSNEERKSRQEMRKGIAPRGQPGGNISADPERQAFKDKLMSYQNRRHIKIGSQNLTLAGGTLTEAGTGMVVGKYKQHRDRYNIELNFGKTGHYTCSENDLKVERYIQATGSKVDDGHMYPYNPEGLDNTESVLYAKRNGQKINKWQKLAWERDNPKIDIDKVTGFY